MALSWLGATSLAHAEGTLRLDTGDTAWVLISTALVLMMTVPGLALFYAGMVRKKNILGTMAHSLGAAAIDDGSIGFDLVGFQNDSGKVGTNPEQLFAMGYAACFDSAVNHVAPTLGLKPTKSSTRVAVGIGQTAGGAFGLDIDITITVEGLSMDDAKRLIEKAHEVCPYSNATRGNVDVRLHVNVVQSFDL